MPTKRAPADVPALMAALDHPLKAEIEAVRAAILSLDKRITEGVKWNAPSFRAADWFATIHVRPSKAVQVILFTGVKVKSTAKTGLKIDDPTGMLKWLAKDRAMATLTGEFKPALAAFKKIAKQWVKQVPEE
jgi:hypothetical protein